MYNSTPYNAAANSELAIASPPPVRQQLQAWMHQCRAATLALFQDVDEDSFCRQAHPDFSPIGWHLGHIGYTESLWLLEKSAGLPAQFPQYHRLFAADGLPKAERQNLPTFTEICQYLAAIRTQVWEYLQIAPLEQEERLWRWLLQHESQHCETISLVLQLQQWNPELDRTALPIAAHPCPETLTEMVLIPAGPFTQGNESIDALDNERPAQVVELRSYWIDRYPVTCGQYRQFIESGGYQASRWWSATGWAWVQREGIQQPLYWSDRPDQATHPVCGVSWYEAEAYANFVGKRLPTEAEWEKAARWHPETGQCFTFPWGEDFPTLEHCNHNHHIHTTTPVNAYPLGQSPTGCMDMLGNVWEWTASWFAGYPDFAYYPYRGYSQVYFDNRHRVLRGGSWATRPWSLRCAFRNWYHPTTRQVLAGFRCISDRPPL